MDKPETEHWICSCCKNNITYFSVGEDNEINVDTHFDLSRSNKEGEVVNDGDMGDIEVIMNILNESKTLGKLFLNKEKNMYIY